ncbi:MAG: 3-dehydroquinate synthase [Verrucomicrobiae bacterium]|nr:3-dehydroquinate synthase [Verrucomicrobiae bacterium]
MPEISEDDGVTRISLTLDQDRYDVIVGEAILANLPTHLAEVGGFRKRAVLVTDSNVGPLYADAVTKPLRAAGYEIFEITVPAGEASKSMEVATDVCRQMLRAGFDRKSFLIALGGGVVGDLAGFVAAIFQRGIPFVQMPTTVVAQVDSSVGGKTGVNTPEGKNLLGAFHQPRLVLADVATLQSLPDREYNEGFAEVIKHAAIRDASLLSLLERVGTRRENLVPLIARNVAIKAAIVEEDERETTGVRALLNFGHTVGHGIENAAGYGRMLHGEAISLGLVAAVRLSVAYSHLNQKIADRLIAVLKQFELPTSLPSDLSRHDIVEAMARDKKFEEGAVRFVLLKSLGDAFVSADVPITAVEDAVLTLYGP